MSEPLEDRASREITFGTYEMAFRAEHSDGGHVRVGVFIGKPGYTRARSGVLVFTQDEWEAFDAARGGQP